MTDSYLPPPSTPSYIVREWAALRQAALLMEVNQLRRLANLPEIETEGKRRRRERDDRTMRERAGR